MSSRTEHPPSTDDGQPRATAMRRAVIGGAAGIALLVGPVVLASAVVPADADAGDVEAAGASGTSMIALQRDLAAADLARLDAFEALQTTTTTAPPPTTTTTTAPPTTTTTAPPTTTTAPPTTAGPVGTDNGGGFGDPDSYATWDALADCESGGNWAANTGNGYYGGLQFSLATWESVGGSGLPSDHPRETQIHFGQVLQSRSGWGQWPHCAAELGLV